MYKNGLLCILLLILAAVIFSCERGDKIVFSKDSVHLSFENAKIKFEIDNQMQFTVYRKTNDQLLSMIRPETPPHYIVINGVQISQFNVDFENIKESEINGISGKGRRLEITGESKGPLDSQIEKILFIDLYTKFPATGFINVQYKNVHSTPGLTIEKEVNNSFKLDASLLSLDYSRHAFWILQGGSYTSRPDWILPVTDSLSFVNYMGKDEATGNHGGGLPVLDVWNQESGLFIGSIREKPTQISLPARVDEAGYLHIGIEYTRNIEFGTDIYKSIPTVIGVHQGDYFNGLRNYSIIMADRGFKMLESVPGDPVYGAVWCGWGLGPDFSQKQMTGMIPMLKELNFNTVTVDDGWFESYGDFVLKHTIFPESDADVAQFINSFHQQGFPVKLWITPGIAGAILMEKHPDWLLRDRNGKVINVAQFGVDRKAAFLCPVLPEVQAYYRQVVKLVIDKWGFDGFKMDFGITNAMGECYARDHQHTSPVESFEALPDLYKIISEETRKLKPQAILEMCPCGTFPSFYKMPYYNQPVASDPNNAWQIRHRGKTIKALMGPQAAYYGDHVERFYSKNNFASMVGVGGIPGSKFVAEEKDDGFLGKKYPVYLDQERRKNFEIWLRVYNENRLASGEYLNLYDIAYDKPETHVIRKENILHYAFYATEWDGEVELRGLEEKDYVIMDYVEGKRLGRIKGGDHLNLKFNHYLLIKAIPADEMETEN
jgi:alpha-galactosidase